MERKIVFSLLATLIAASVHLAQAQQPGKIPRLGILEPGSSANLCTAGMRQGLVELGYVDGQNLVIESRFGEAKPDRLSEAAANLVRSAPDIIWTHSPPAVLAAKKATATIPVVVGTARDLVEQGIVESLARPGGNITGMESSDNEILGNRLEILKETIPRASRVVVIVNPNDPGHAMIPKNIEPEARALKVRLQRVETSGPETFNKAFAAMAQGRADALLIPEGSMFSQNSQRIFELATSKRLPTAAGGPHFADAGGSLSYGANVRDMCRQSATLVDKILKGRKPADLPVERPVKFEFVVNLKTAKQIGLTIPPNLLVRADRVIR